jgi:GT2 family glycosyltransferase
MVVNYDGREVTLAAVASLRAMDYAAFDVVVFDNGSRDGSQQALAAAFPDLEQVRKDVNEGSATGYSLAMRWAIERGYAYVLLLNNDIEVEPTMLTELVRLAESDESAGAVGPKCYFHAQRDRLWSAGGILRFRESITRERGYGEIDRGQFDRDAEVDYVNGCAILIRAAAVRDIGLWDGVFRICVDDADFCTRLVRRGWRCLYAHRAVLYHRVAYTTGGYRPERNFEFGRSSAIYARRYAGPLDWLAFLFFLLASYPVAYLRELRRGNQAAATAKLRGAWAGLRERLGPPPRV